MNLMDNLCGGRMVVVVVVMVIIVPGGQRNVRRLAHDAAGGGGRRNNLDSCAARPMQTHSGEDRHSPVFALFLLHGRAVGHV